MPIGEVGDNYDRYLVCVEEMHQSLRIVEQCLERLERHGPRAGEHLYDPRGALAGQGPRLQPHGRADPAVQGGDRGARACRQGEGYLAIESANGELGFYLVSDGSAVPYKVRCRPPSFINLAPMGDDAEAAPCSPT